MMKSLLFVLLLAACKTGVCTGGETPGKSGIHAGAGKPAADSLCRHQNLKILRHLSLRGEEKKQYKALLGLLEDEGFTGGDNRMILRAFADCWAGFKRQKIGEGFSAYAVDWDERAGILTFTTPYESFGFKTEAAGKLPARIHKTVRVVSSYPDAAALSDVLWFIWTEAAIASLNNRYNGYIYAEETDWYTATSSGRVFTVGFLPKFDNGTLYIDRILDEKLEQAGIQPGFEVLDIDSGYVDVLDTSEWWVQQEPFKYTLSCKSGDKTSGGGFTSIPRFSGNVQFKLIDDIAYIRIEYFDGRTGIDLSRYFRVVDDNIRGIIMDLRDNPGGTVTPMAVDYFLKPAQTVLVVREKGQEQKRYNGTIAYYPQPLVVLQNRHSASMAELVSAMLGSQKRAHIVGETSYGKAVGQKTYKVGEEGMAMLVEAQYYYPDGVTHWGDVGVKPDTEIRLSAIQQEKISKLLYAESIDLQALREVDPYLSEALKILGENP